MSEAHEPPLFAGTILGLRAWVIESSSLDPGPEDIFLGSYFAEGRWEQGGRWTVASCQAPHGSRRHVAPAGGCACGLYAWHPEQEAADALWIEHLKLGPDPDPCHPEISGVAGVVEACGRVELHRTGFRAEQARVKALLVGSDWPPEMLQGVRRIADVHQAELVTLARPDELVAYCRQQGSALSAEQVKELVPDEAEQILRRARSRASSPSPPASPPSPPHPLDTAGRVLRKLGEAIWIAFIVCLGLLFYGGIAACVVMFAGAILFGWFDTGPKPPPAARVAKVRVDREKCTVSALVRARKPVDELTLRATGRDVRGKGLGHLTDNFGPIERGSSWIKVGELKHNLCRLPDPFTVRVRVILPGRVGAPASVRSVAGQESAEPATQPVR